MRKEQTSLSMYFSEVQGGRLLTREEEISLAQTMDAARYRDKRGKISEYKLWQDDVDPATLHAAKKAREKLINSNLRLVAAAAKNMQGKGCELEDLIQEGNIGLMNGVDRYDWRRGLKISTYCTWWIRQRMERLISNHGKTVRVPVHVHTLSSKLRTLIENYNKEFGCNPNIDEISAALECSREMSKAALNNLNNVPNVAIDHSPAGYTDSDETLHSYIEDEDAANPMETISQKELVDCVKEVLSSLSERDEKILRLRFGIAEESTDHKNWPITEEEMSVLQERANHEKVCNAQ